MKKFLALCVAAIHLYSVAAFAASEYCIVPSVTSPVPDVQSFSTGGNAPSCASVTPPAPVSEPAACAFYASIALIGCNPNPGGCHWTIYKQTTPGPNYGRDICDIWNDVGGHVTGYFESQTCSYKCPTGSHWDQPPPNNTTCLNDNGKTVDDWAAANSATVVRDSNGVVSSFTMGTNTWTVSAYDSLGRITNWTAPGGKAYTASYYPNSSDTYQVTDVATGLSTTMLWVAHNLDKVLTPDGLVYNFKYVNLTPSHTADNSYLQLANIEVQTSYGDCGTGRSGTLVPPGVPTTPLIFGDLADEGTMFAMRESAQGVPAAPFGMVFVVAGEQVIIYGAAIVGAAVLAPAASQALNAVADFCLALGEKSDSEKKRDKQYACWMNYRTNMGSCQKYINDPAFPIELSLYGRCKDKAWKEYTACMKAVEAEFPGIDPQQPGFIF